MGRTAVRRHGLVAVATLTLLAGMTAPAIATPVETLSAPEVAPRTATQDEKVKAAAALGIVAGPSLLVLNDRNFVFALWEQASGTEVRASAELAFAGGDLECTQWIKTGIHEARVRDQTNKLRDDETARAAREGKKRAAAVNLVVAGPELLIQGDRDFVYAMWERASGPRVKAAARAAYEGSATALKEFIETGIFQARAQDQQDKVVSDDRTSKEQKAALAAKDARTRAVAVFGVIATEAMLVEPDDNFVLELWVRAVPGSEIAAAAEDSLRSSDPGALRRFIDTGIFEANRRDRDNRLKKKAAADRLRAFELRTRASNSKVHPALVAAADAALAGTDHDVDVFLRVGQTEDRALVQTVRALTPAVRGYYLRGTRDVTISVAGGGADANWRILPGLADPSCHSLESVAQPNHYLRQQSDVVTLAPTDGTDAFYTDATWCSTPSADGTGASLVSFSARGRALRHLGTEVWAAQRGGSTQRYDTPDQYDQNTSWQIDTPTILIQS
ncbi:AbfB domain-containing protein [Amycolatopsis sp. NPDC004079]|uniref:AbfB domain-containing protein n=1 Tax=Amycolatopsis sp. NPDC004079 TaxID=3154549 RepID=UPI0033A13F00